MLTSEKNLIDLKPLAYEFIVLHFGPCLAKEGRKCILQELRHIPG
jgi:hypothetical protein